MHGENGIAEHEPATTEFSHAAKIKAFDEKFPGLAPQPVLDRSVLVGVDELEKLLSKIISSDPEEVVLAAHRLNDIVSGSDASASALRIKVLAYPMALDNICHVSLLRRCLSSILSWSLKAVILMNENVHCRGSCKPKRFGRRRMHSESL